ncbi:MAG: FHA domain-containing protein, partial [Firmicutes bacterium]|nr:FHA domain-containing protein [Bacillota bacterium]
MWELQIFVKARQKERVALKKHEVVIGRSSQADICLDAPTISRRHARLSMQDGAWEITDLGSRSGIQVNGVKTDYGLLRHGDQIEIRQFTLMLIDTTQTKIGLTQHHTVWSDETFSPGISTLTITELQKVSLSNLAELNVLSEALLSEQSPPMRMRLLCQFVSGHAMKANWAAIISVNLSDERMPMVHTICPD